MTAPLPPEEIPRTLELHGLLDRIAVGEEGAREELIRRVMGQLDSLARGMLRKFPAVGRWEETGDVLNSALLRLLQALRSVRPESTRRFYGLAAEMIRRELLDLARAYRRETGDSSSGGLPEVAAPDDGDLKRWQAFHDGVAALPVEQREVVGLIFYHDWTHEQVAELFGVSVKTVGRRWQEALETLRRTASG